MFEFIDQFDFLDALIVFGVVNFVFGVIVLLLINKIMIQNNKNTLLLGRLTQAVVDNSVLLKNETATLKDFMVKLSDTKQFNHNTHKLHSEDL